MSISAKAAFVGYSYQLQVATFLVFLLEEKLYSIEKIIAEADTDSNFDDIRCIRSSPHKNIYIQVKNTKINTVTFNDNKVFFNNVEIRRNINDINVIVTNNPHNLALNSNENGFLLYKNEESNLFVVQLNSEWITDYIFNKFNPSRIHQLISIANKKFTTYHDCVVEFNDLPNLTFIPSDLLEKTIQIRKIEFESHKILFVIGKPGVGKSHLLNELEIQENRLYRFWISNQDSERGNRLRYETFINELTYKLFNSARHRTEEEIIDKLASDKTPFYIDGLDHVENYLPLNLQKYFSFFERVNNRDGVKLIILTRPLNHTISYPSISLEDWNFEETREYLKQRGIVDYEAIRKIYNIAKGYPIVTGFLASEWVNSGGKITSKTEINEISDYYDEVLNTVRTKNDLAIFSLTTTFFLYDELEVLFEENKASLFEFIDSYPFLFEINNKRISLIHDSFNNYVATKIIKNKILETKLNNFVEQSLMNAEPRFMSRILSYKLSSPFLSKLLHRYCVLDEFIKLKNNILDYESIRNFYYSLRKIYAKPDIEKLSPKEAYEFSLILIVLMRDNVEQSYALLFQLYSYLKKNGINWKKEIFSSNSIYYAFSHFDNSNPETLFKLEIDKGYRGIDIANSLENQLYEEKVFFSRYKEDNYDKYKNFVRTHSQYETSDALTSMLVNAYLFNHDEDGFLTTIRESLLGNFYLAMDRLNTYLRRLGWKHITNFTPANIISKARATIIQLGCNAKDNDYINLTLKEMIQKYAIEGSFQANDIVTGYLRLANEQNRVIDIKSLGYYQSLYYEHKDYSIVGISEIFYELIVRKKITIPYAFETIAIFQEMSDKGIRHLSYELVNLLGPNYVHELEENNIFFLARKYQIWFTELMAEVIDAVKEEYAKKNITNIIREELEKQARLNGEKILKKSEYSNILKSKYEKHFRQEAERNGLKLVDETEIIGTGILQEGSQLIKEENRPESYNLDRGVVMASEREYYKKIGLDYLTFARCGGGWYEKLPYPDFLNLYNKKILKNDVEKIIQYIITKSFTSTQFSDERIENGSDRGLLSGLPKFLLYVGHAIDWNHIKESIIKIVNISLGKI